MNQTESAPTWVLRLAPWGFVFLWSTGFIGARLGLPDAPPLQFLLWRFLLVLLIMLPLAIRARAPFPDAKGFLHIAIAGILLQGGYLSGVFISISLGLSPGLAALIVGLQPLLTACCGRWIGERPGTRQWWGLVIGFIGVSLALSHRTSTAGLNISSLGFILMALLSITLGTLYQKRNSGQYDWRSQSVIQFSAAGLILLPPALWWEPEGIRWTPSFVFALLWLVLVLSCGAIPLLFFLLRRGATTSVSSLMYLTPPTTSLIAWILFDDALGPYTLLGMLISAVGVAWASSKPAHSS